MSKFPQVQILCDTQEELNQLKNRSTKLRVILLERQNKNMFCKLSSFTARDKAKFVKEINEIWNSMSDSEIDEEFNDICSNKLFESGTDVSAYPVEESSFPDHSILYNPRDVVEVIEEGEEETKS